MLIIDFTDITLRIAPPATPTLNEPKRSGFLPWQSPGEVIEGGACYSGGQFIERFFFLMTDVRCPLDCAGSMLDQ